MIIDYAHTTQVIQTTGSEPKAFRAACRNCDWRGAWSAHQTKASREGFNHEGSPTESVQG